MSGGTGRFDWKVAVFLFPRTLIDGSRSKSCELLAWRKLGGIKYYRHVTEDEVAEYYSTESW